MQSPSTDADFLDLLRTAGPLSVAELADAMEVTPTAVRQRLTRLMSQEIIQREAIRNAARHARGDTSASPLHLLIGADYRDGLEIRIEDNGVGMKNEEIFDCYTDDFRYLSVSSCTTNFHSKSCRTFWHLCYDTWRIGQ
jgi:DNA-binding Lrp family transcriptional regulator